MKHFILPFPEQENKLKPKFGVRAINTKRPRQQLSSRAKISKVEREKRRKSIKKKSCGSQPTNLEGRGRRQAAGGIITRGNFVAGSIVWKKFHWAEQGRA